MFDKLKKICGNSTNQFYLCFNAQSINYLKFCTEKNCPIIKLIKEQKKD